MELLETPEAEVARVVSVQYVFQCAISEALIPRVAAELRFAELSADGYRWRIEQGPTGEPRSRACFVLRPSSDAPSAAPDASDILAAMRRHHLDIQRFRLFGQASMSESDDESSEVPRPEVLKRVSMVDRTPELMYLATVVYQSPDADLTTLEWRIADPFGLVEVRRLQFDGERIRRSNHDFREYLNGLLDRKGAVLRPGELTPRELWQFAEEAVAGALPSLPSDWPGRPHLVEMEEAWLAARETTNERQALGRQRHCAQKARCVVEACLKHVAARFPLAVVRGVLPPRGPVGDAVLLSRFGGALKSLGLAVPTAGRFSRVQGSALFHVVHYGDMSKLTSAVVASVLAAHRTSGHVIRDVAQAWPTLLDDLDAVIGIGGEASHHGTDDLQSDAVERAMKIARRLVETLVATATYK
jgi:hypothetical protein